MKHEILSICTAYGHGYGQGYDQRSLKNPYKPGSDEWQAWDYGYGEGNRKKVDSSMEVQS